MEIVDKVKDSFPKDVIDRVELEGCEIVVYTKDKIFFLDANEQVKELVSELKKRIEVRLDNSMCNSHESAKEKIMAIVPQEALIKDIRFEPERSLVIVTAGKPGLVIGRGGETFRKIKEDTLWVPKIERSPEITSNIVRSIRQLMTEEVKWRIKFLKQVGKNIFSEKITNRDWIRVFCLGSFREVGRSCILVETPKSKVLMDCGINTGGNGSNMYPFINAREFDLSELDAIILSHAHMDHCLTPDTLVQLSNGDIKQIWEVENGQSVEALDFKYSMKIEGIPAIQRGSINAPNPIYEVRTKTKRIKATGNHPLFVLNEDGTFQIKHVEQLKPGDFIATPRIITTNSSEQKMPQFKSIKKLDGNFAQLLGYLVGDGCNRESTTIMITDKNIKNLEFYSKELTDLGIKNNITIKDRNRINIYSSEFKKWLEKIEPSIFNKSPIRKIPRIVCKSDNKIVARFLKGLYDAEGCVKDHSVVLSTSSEDIAIVTQMLLLRFSIISHLYDHDQSKSTFGGKDVYQLCISNPESLNKFYEKIGFSDISKYQKIKKVLDKIGKGVKKIDLIPIREKAILDIAYEMGLKKIDLRKMNIHYYHYSKHHPSRKKVIEICQKLSKVAKSKKIINEKLQILNKLSQAPILWDSVVSTHIIKTDSKKVYDLTVPGHSNYIANGIFVHNCGFIPYLYEYGYDGPLYCTTPTLDLVTMLTMDYIDVMQKNATQPLFTAKGVKEAVKHAITLDWNEVSDVGPDVRLTFQPSGHLLGSSLVHLHVGQGLHNIVYSADLKFTRTRLFDPAFTNFQRIETLFVESTYGAQDDIMPSRMDAEEQLMKVINQTVERKGVAVIPSFAVGRAQEIMAILDAHKFEYPVFLDGMIWDATAIHATYPEYLSNLMERKILQGENPFTNPIFKRIGSQADREKSWAEKPAVIISTSGMMEGGPIMSHLQNLGEDKKNSLIFVGYQGEGTMGRRIQRGWKEIPINANGKTNAMKLELDVTTVGGLSGHADVKELINYINRLASKPERIITNHGENGKPLQLASNLHRLFRIETLAPKNLEAIRLR